MALLSRHDDTTRGQNRRQFCVSRPGLPSSGTPLIPVTVGEAKSDDSSAFRDQDLWRHTRDTRERFATTVLRFATRTCGDTPATHANALQTRRTLLLRIREAGLGSAGLGWSWGGDTWTRALTHSERHGGDIWARALWSSPLA